MVTVPLFPSDGVDNTVVVSYDCMGQKSVITVGDVREDLAGIAYYQKMILESTDNLKSGFTEQILIPRLMEWEIAASGLTNTPEFKNKFAAKKDYIYYTLLREYGNDIINSLLTNGKFLFAGASHILFSVPETVQVAGHLIKLSPEKFAEKSLKQEAAAKESLEVLKKSKDLENDFAEMAKKLSGDTLSGENGGDLGYFSEYTMVKEFSDAVFGMKTKGLVPHPVKTKFGWHIIYVTLPPALMNYRDVEQKMGEAVNGIWQAVGNGLKNANLAVYFSIDYKSSEILAGGNTYTLKTLPPWMKLMDIWGEPYTWEKCRKIIDIFVPGFSSNMTLISFGEQTGNCGEFMYFAQKALTDGADKSPGFQAKYKKQLQDVLTEQCADEFHDAFHEKAAKMVTPADVLKYYQEHKKMGKYVEIKKDIKGDFIMNKKTGKPEMETIPFEKASNAIADELIYQNQKNIYTEWKNNAMKNYHVEFSEKGLEVLFDAVKKDLGDKLK
jgi:hypothetical protein